MTTHSVWSCWYLVLVAHLNNQTTLWYPTQNIKCHKADADLTAHHVQMFLMQEHEAKSALHCSSSLCEYNLTSLS